MNRIMKDRSGNAALFAIIIILSLMLMFIVISEYLRLQIIASGVRRITIFRYCSSY